MLYSSVCHLRQEDRGKGSTLTCGELERCVLLSVRLCRTQRKSAPTGGRRSKREGESWVERRRSQISQWLHGVMYLWSAAMDCNPRSLLFILPLLLSCVVPAFPIIYPPNEGKATLSLRTCVFMCVCARACEWCATARIAGRVLCAHRGLATVQIIVITTRRWSRSAWWRHPGPRRAGVWSLTDNN